MGPRQILSTLKKSFLFDHVLLITKLHGGGSEGSHGTPKSDYMIFGGPSKGLRLRLAMIYKQPLIFPKGQVRIKENPILTSWSDLTNIWEKATAQVCMISVKRRWLQFPMLLLFIHLAACLCATLPCPVAHLVARWRLAEHPIEYLGASAIQPFQHVGFKQNQLVAFDAYYWVVLDFLFRALEVPEPRVRKRSF